MNFISSQPTRSCHDIESYRNRLGMNCEDHRTPLKCESYDQVGFDDQEVYRLIVNCAQTCGICDLQTRPSLLQFVFKMQALSFFNGKEKGPKIPTTDVFFNYHPTHSPTLFLTWYPTQNPTYGTTQSPTRHHTSHPTKKPINCRDSKSFRTFLGLKCARHRRLGCDAMTTLGFTVSQMTELRINCPVTCGLCNV